MKKLIKSLLSHFDLDIRRKSLLRRADDPFSICELLFLGKTPTTIIDAGASIGSISQMLSLTFPAAKIHAFEPFQAHFEELLKVASKNKQIFPIRKALSNKKGKRFLHINQSSGTNSLLEAGMKGQEIYGDQLKPIGRTEVECITLDDYMEEKQIDKVDLLKLDLQGGEIDALNGASQSLKAGKFKCIICEVMFEASYNFQPSAASLIYEFTEKYDYSFINFYQHHHHHGRLIQADAVFLHPSFMNSIERNFHSKFHPYSNLPIR